MLKKVLAIIMAAMVLFSTMAMGTSAKSKLNYSQSDVTRAEQEWIQHGFVLKEGFSKNNKTLVKHLQQMLRDLGYSLEVDGIYGPETKKAVRQFQMDQGLVADGIFGTNSRNTLLRVYRTALDSIKNSNSNSSSETSKTTSMLFTNTKSKVITYSLSSDGKTYLTDHFKVKEFKCNDGSNKILIDQKLVALLEDLREHFGKPVIITSAYRTTTYNSQIGGATDSYHTKGMAADIYIRGVNPLEIAKYAESIGCKGIGLYGDFVHVDTRTSKSYWKTADEIKVNSFNR